MPLRYIRQILDGICGLPTPNFGCFFQRNRGNMVMVSNHCGFQIGFCGGFSCWAFFRVRGGGAVSVILYVFSTCFCTRGFESCLGYLSTKWIYMGTRDGCGSKRHVLSNGSDIAVSKRKSRTRLRPRLSPRRPVCARMQPQKGVGRVCYETEDRSCAKTEQVCSHSAQPDDVRR